MRAPLSLLAAVAACGSSGTTIPDGAPAPRQHATITAMVKSTRFVTREAMLAAGEMQLSGAPLATAMRRDLGAYSRAHLPPDIYFDSSPLAIGPWIDLTGFATAIESHEYSRQPMTDLAFEAGAGTSLAHGPLVDPTGAGGPAATAALAALVQRFSVASNAQGRFVFPAGTYPANNPSGNRNPHGAGDSTRNPVGWPGIWPTNHVFRAFDPTIDPSDDDVLACAIVADDDPGSAGVLGCADYECDASTLHLRDRAAQVDPVITPGADGFASWKVALWLTDDLRLMHDSFEVAVAAVDDADLAAVGVFANRVTGFDAAGHRRNPGTYLGASDLEGFQAQLLLAAADNRAADWLGRLTTTDGATLSGFATLAEALAYDYQAPLRWFPGEIAVAEDDDGSGFPRPGYSLGSARSSLLDLAGLALGYTELFALTDGTNREVGGAQPALVFFDGDPFPADDQLADGEPTLHDRALAMLRVAWIDADRMHGDPASGVLVDEVAADGTRGAVVSTPTLAYTVLALAATLRALSAQLDALPIHYPGADALAFSDRLRAILAAEAGLLLDHLTDASGRAFAGWDLAAGAATGDDGLDAHTAAIRGLFAAYLATGETRYRDRALAVFARLQSTFYDPGARIYAATPVDAAAASYDVEYTPLRFALLQSALRDVHELVASRPGQEELEALLEERLGRLDKLVLNGWDDRNQDRLVDWPAECVNTVDGLPRGGLQMAERALTGELGSFEPQPQPGQPRTPTADREHDCVPEIDDAHLPAALAASVTFHVVRD